jgi:hypothetical protein
MVIDKARSLVRDLGMQAIPKNAEEKAKVMMTGETGSMRYSESAGRSHLTIDMDRHTTCMCRCDAAGEGRIGRVVIGWSLACVCVLCYSGSRSGAAQAV